VLAPAGMVLRPGALALLASLGQVRPVVTCQPWVVHLATGNEIVAPEETPRPGQIRDSNSILVRVFLHQWGIGPQQQRLPEEEGSAHSALRMSHSALERADLLLVSGGAGVGEHDFARRLLESLGFTIHLGKTSLRPGKPLIVAVRAGMLAFGLPGNPLAHFVCLNLFVRAALEVMSGRAAEPLFRRGALAETLDGEANERETFWPATCRHLQGTPLLLPLRWRSSGDLTCLATANALVRVPGRATRLAAGTAIEYVATDDRP